MKKKEETAIRKTKIIQSAPDVVFNALTEPKKQLNDLRYSNFGLEDGRQDQFGYRPGNSS
ncbi:MAG TPA: hypothetical protein VI146_08045 [Nitrososphaeraceae archaeon]